jgi:hypothetical protein
MATRTRTLAVSCAVALVVVTVATAASPSVTIFANHSVAEDCSAVAARNGLERQAERGRHDRAGRLRSCPWDPLRDVRTGDGGDWVSYADGDENFRLCARWRGAVSRGRQPVAQAPERYRTQT